LSRPALCLLAVSAACVVLGLGALVFAWGNPDSDPATLLASAAGWEFPLLPCPGGPVLAPCAVLVSMALVAVFAGLTLGFAFPAVLPVAAATISAASLRGRPPSRRRLRAGIAAVALCWLLVASGGLVLAHG